MLDEQIVESWSVAELQTLVYFSMQPGLPAK
jgi:hypothetical protein